MKIIHVLSGLAKGGGERVAVELANEAVKNGDAVTILAGWPEDPHYLQNKIHPDVSIKFISSAKRFAYLKSILWILTHRKWIRGWDVLHCHLTFGAVFGAVTSILLKKILRNKTPLILETNHAVGMPVSKFNRWFHSRIASQLDGMVLMAKDPYWDSFILKHPHLKIEFIPNGISVFQIKDDAELKDKLLNQTGISENYEYLIGTISMLRTDRKPWLYVPVFYEIYKVLGKRAHFILGGSGEEYDEINRLVQEAGLSKNFHLIGLVNEPMEVIYNLDMYISLSVGEAVGISMIEAAMCNVPVVGIQMIENYKAKNDWIWSDTDITEVAKKIIFLLQNPKERYKLAEIQNKYVTNHFTSEAMYTSYTSFYKRILTA
ncbi:MAG: hypothetical protein JWO92_986 [Chitinophagaceae bacterium]|nr:hypothetical protein [Chitinophagaceae bacterium]MDB5222737.1 hypothetical protein [Chitinophagaceae bacterium]